MKLVIQRVKQAKVDINGQTHAEIGPGLLALVGFLPTDTARDAAYLADKLCKIRVFEDADGKMNQSAADIGGSLMLVPNFTLYATASAGTRPSFSAAAPAEVASVMFDAFVLRVREAFLGEVACGVFRAHMEVSLCNDGPVTIVLDSSQNRAK